MSEVYYSVSEAAYILGVSEDVVLRAIRMGELDAGWEDGSMKGSGKGYRMTVSALEEFMYYHQTDRELAQIGRVNEKRINDDYLETLDENEERLFDEVLFMQELKETFRRMGL